MNHIHIFQYKSGAWEGKFDVAVPAKNQSDLLYATHQGFERRSGAIKNILATWEVFGKGKRIIIQDDSLKKITAWRYENGKKKAKYSVEKPYIPNNDGETNTTVDQG